MDRLKGRVAGLAIAILTVLFIGTCGFVIIEDYPVFDALYMSLITITTVGYSEIIPLTRAGRIFNAFLLLFGVGTMFYAIGVMTQTIIELQLGEFFGRRRVRKMIDNLFLILSAKALNPGLKVSSRVNEEEAEDKPRRAGADSIFRPYNITGYRLAQSIICPYLSEFRDITSSTVDMGMNIGLEQQESEGYAIAA